MTVQPPCASCPVSLETLRPSRAPEAPERAGAPRIQPRRSSFDARIRLYSTLLCCGSGRAVFLEESCGKGMANLKPQNPLRRRNSGAPTWIHGPKLAEDLASPAAIKENARYTGKNQMLDMVSQASPFK